MGLIEEFAQALVHRSAEELPPEARHETRRTLLNVLGTAVGASRSPEADKLVALGLEKGGGEVVPPGRSEVLDRYMAALEIGFAGHYDDFDDTHLETVIHPGAATLGALYPLALLRQASGHACLMAFALGVESQLRVGIAMSPSHYDAGWHITGTCGVVGAAVTSGLLMDLDAAQLASAIAISLNFSLGHREAFGTPVKPFHAGKAAWNGLLAASLATAGLGLDRDVFERDGGFFSVFADAFDPSPLSSPSIASSYVLLDNTYKPFPCGIVAHPAIEAAINLHQRLGQQEIATLRSITVRCNPLVPELMGRREATTGLEARFCALHGVAVGLLLGRGGIAEFSDARARDVTVAALREKARLVPDDSCARQSATISVELADGSTASSDVVAAAGSREHPMTDGQLLAKFTELVDPVLPGRAEAIAKAVMDLGQTTSITDIQSALDQD